ncbi:MAG: hypothetical protein IH614_13220, partial [Desulfuromonadales bacterium]|nr:hypothetical protein [Desulfuromonadales bacterium]
IAFSADAMIRDLQYEGGRLTLAAGTRGVLFLELRPTAPPVLLGSVADGNSAWQLAGRGDYLYVISGEQEEPLKRSLQVIDISDPRQPTITARQPVIEKLNALAVHGDYLLAATSQGLALFSLTDPAQPSRSGFLPLPAAARCITTLGDLAFISDAVGSLQVIDLRNPQLPRLVGTAPIPWTLQPFALGSEMAVHGDLVLVADGRNGLLVFSVKDRRRPRLTGVSQLPNGGLAIGVTVAEQRAYVTDSRQGLHLIDLRTPENPQLIATLSNTSWSKRIALIDDQILLANGDAGLMFLPRPVEIDQPRIGSGNNLTFSLPPNLPAGTYTVRVFNRWSSAELPGALNVGHR